MSHSDFAWRRVLDSAITFIAGVGAASADLKAQLNRGCHLIPSRRNERLVKLIAVDGFANPNANVQL